MMVLAGIDEAGLGPKLGPLATAAAAIEVPDDWTPDSPWGHLETAFCRQWRRGETRAVAADSKVVYRAGGMRAMELTVGAFSILANASPEPPLATPGVMEKGETHPCYSHSLRPFPAYTEMGEMEAVAGAMRTAMSRYGASAAHMETALLYEPALNRRYLEGMNKNEALLVETGRHLQRLAEAFSTRPLLVIVDKQGGRNDYLPFLMSLFPGAWLEVLTCGGMLSAYRWRRRGGEVEFRFQAKADGVSFITALASLAAKYVRERAMAEFNGWFRERAPGLQGTAGYPEDARRWLAEVRSLSNCGEFELELLERFR